MGALLLRMRANLGELSAQPYADRFLELQFDVNPRYGPLDDASRADARPPEERLAAVPGVEGVVPQGTDWFDVDVHPADPVAGLELASPQQVRAIAAPAGYFPLMGISFVRGRDFDAAERSHDGAIVIGSGLARRLWGGADAIGRRLVSVGPQPARHPDVHHRRRRGRCDHRRARRRAVVNPAPGPGVARIFMPRVRTTVTSSPHARSGRTAAAHHSRGGGRRSTGAANRRRADARGRRSVGTAFRGHRHLRRRRDWRSRAPALCHRPLRRRGVRGRAAGPWDRHSHGAWCREPSGRQTVRAARSAALSLGLVSASRSGWVACA